MTAATSIISPKNIAGVTELKVKGKKGTKLRLKHGELLDKNGMVNMANIDYHYRPTDDSDPFLDRHRHS